MDTSLHLLANTGDGAWAIDDKRRIVYWNDSATKLLGHQAEEVVGRHCYEVIKGRTSEHKLFCQQQCPIQTQMQKEEIVHSQDLIVRHQDGRDLLINLSTLTTSNKSVGEQSIRLIHLFRLLGEITLSPPILRIYLLGQTAVCHHDDSPLQSDAWRRVKVRSLLAFLALRRGRPAHRELLAESLWPDLEYSAAIRNLNITVYHLRRCIEPFLKKGADSQYIIYEGDHYLLNGGAAHWLDVEVFETNMRKADLKTNIKEAIELYQKAIVLYRGDLLIDLGQNGDWAGEEQGRLRELYLSGLEKLGGLYEQQQQIAKAKESYLKAMAVDPCCERTCQQLIRLLLCQGDRVAAIVHYQRLADVLHTELDIQPAAETRQLYETARRIS